MAGAAATSATLRRLALTLLSWSSAGSENAEEWESIVAAAGLRRWLLLLLLLLLGLGL